MRPANNFQKLHLSLSKILVRTAVLYDKKNLMSFMYINYN